MLYFVLLALPFSTLAFESHGISFLSGCPTTPPVVTLSANQTDADLKEFMGRYHLALDEHKCPIPGNATKNTPYMDPANATTKAMEPKSVVCDIDFPREFSFVERTGSPKETLEGGPCLACQGTSFSLSRNVCASATATAGVKLTEAISASLGITLNTCSGSSSSCEKANGHQFICMFSWKHYYKIPARGKWCIWQVMPNCSKRLQSCEGYTNFEVSEYRFLSNYCSKQNRMVCGPP